MVRNKKFTNNVCIDLFMYIIHNKKDLCTIYGIVLMVALVQSEITFKIFKEIFTSVPNHFCKLGLKFKYIL